MQLQEIKAHWTSQKDGFQWCAPVLESAVKCEQRKLTVARIGGRSLCSEHLEFGDGDRHQPKLRASLLYIVKSCLKKKSVS